MPKSTEPDFSDFCVQWYFIQTAAMTAMFRLLGRLSERELEAMLRGDAARMNLVRAIRNSITPIVIDETGRSRRTAGFREIYHNHLFKECAQMAGAQFPEDMSRKSLLPEVNAFLLQVQGLHTYKELFCFLRATKSIAVKIFERMREKFEAQNAPDDAFAYIEVHELIEAEHNSESASLQRSLEIRNMEVDDYRELWDGVLRSIGLIDEDEELY